MVSSYWIASNNRLLITQKRVCIQNRTDMEIPKRLFSEVISVTYNLCKNRSKRKILGKYDFYKYLSSQIT